MSAQRDLAKALHHFIESGSANGTESMRRECRKLIPVFAAAPELLAALEEIAEGRGPYKRDPLEFARAVIEKHQALAVAAIAKTKEEIYYDPHP